MLASASVIAAANTLQGEGEGGAEESQEGRGDGEVGEVREATATATLPHQLLLQHPNQDQDQDNDHDNARAAIAAALVAGLAGRFPHLSNVGVGFGLDVNEPTRAPPLFSEGVIKRARFADAEVEAFNAAVSAGRAGGVDDDMEVQPPFPRFGQNGLAAAALGLGVPGVGGVGGVGGIGGPGAGLGLSRPLPGLVPPPALKSEFAPAAAPPLQLQGLPASFWTAAAAQAQHQQQQQQQQQHVQASALSMSLPVPTPAQLQQLPLHLQRFLTASQPSLNLARPNARFGVGNAPLHPPAPQHHLLRPQLQPQPQPQPPPLPLQQPHALPHPALLPSLSIPPPSAAPHAQPALW